MSWLELRWNLLAFDRHLALDWLLRVLLIRWESTKGFVVTGARWVRRPERLVMLAGRSSLRFGPPMGNSWIFFENLFV